MSVESFEELVTKLNKIENKGFVKSMRKDNTGVGYTLETMLGIEENNVPGPDAAGIELKAMRKNSNSMTTLFTKEPPRNRREIWNTDLVERLGYVDEKGREALKVTIEVNDPNNQGFFLTYTEKKVKVCHEKYGLCAAYPIKLLRKTFERKLPELIIVKADTKRENGQEYFHYNEAYYLREFDSDEFLQLMREGVITLDLRMHIKENGNIRNRGTAWRILEERKLDKAFELRKSLLDENLEIENEESKIDQQKFLKDY